MKVKDLRMVMFLSIREVPEGDAWRLLFHAMVLAYGIPQGSGMSTILFNNYMKSLGKTPD